MADKEEDIPPAQASPEPEKSEAEEHEKSEDDAMKRPASKAACKAKAKALPKGKAKASPKSSSSKPIKTQLKKKPAASPMKITATKPQKGSVPDNTPETPKKTKKTPKDPPSAPMKAKPSKKPAVADSKKSVKKAKKDNKAAFSGLKANKKEEKKNEDQEENPEEEQDFEDDQEIDQFALEKTDGEENKKTDRSKKQKFQAMLAGNQLPDYVKKQWENTKTMKSGRTEAQRTIINSIFDRTSQGKLILSLDKPVFNSMRAQFQEKTASSIEKSLPKSLFMGKFNLSPDLFAEGLASGDFTEVIDDSGRVQYTWASKEHKTKKGDKTQVGVTGQIEGKKEDGSKFDSIMQKNWSMGLFTRTQNANTKNPAGKTQLALMDRKASLTEAQWHQAQTQLNQAMPAFDKCEKDGLKYLQIVGTDNKEDPLYQSLQLGCTYFTFGYFWSTSNFPK